jgi:hypothetical protein
MLGISFISDEVLMAKVTSKEKFDIIMNTSMGDMEMGFRTRKLPSQHS